MGGFISWQAMDFIVYIIFFPFPIVNNKKRRSSNLPNVLKLHK